MELSLIWQLAVAAGLGMIVGLQREWVQSHGRVAGVRTFPLIAIFGVLSGHLSLEFGGWVFGASLVALGLLVFGAYWIQATHSGREKESLDLPGEEERGPDMGLTTEMAILVVFGVGGLLSIHETVEAIVLGGLIGMLLQWKKPLHGLVKRMGEEEVRAIFRFVLIALVILPVLPNEDYGPYQVLNPFEIWLMVVLIVGISLGAYLGHRLLGDRIGTLLAGLLGGLISSTATAVSTARRSNLEHVGIASPTLVVLLSSTVVFGRVLVEVAVVGPSTLSDIGPPLGAMMGIMVVLCLATGLWSRGRLVREAEEDDRNPPSELSAAVGFGLLYGLVLLGVAFAKENLGQSGLYVVAGLSGLTDMDAITLSTVKLVTEEQLTAGTGWRLILVGSMANLFFKGLAVAVLGSFRLFWRVALLFLLAAGGGAAILFLWP